MTIRFFYVLIAGIFLTLLIPINPNCISGVNNDPTESSPMRGTIVVNTSGGGDHTTIQTAIDASNNGDTVFVAEGVYRENLLINKSIDLIGASSCDTIIDGTGGADTIIVTSNRVNISGFFITNSSNLYLSSGIKVFNSVFSNIHDCTLIENFNGITLIDSSNCTVFDTIISDNRYDGISLVSSSGNRISKNVVSDNLNHGIHVQTCSNNIIENNSCFIGPPGTIPEEPSLGRDLYDESHHAALSLPVSNFNADDFSPSVVPGSYSFGFTIVDDTDNSKLEYIKPIYDYLTEIGMRGTRALWVRDSDGYWGRKGDTTNRTDYRDYCVELQDLGFEIAMHTPSGDDDTREQIIWGFNRFKEIFGDYPYNYVMHSSNKENFWGGENNFGHDPHSPYYCIDIIRDMGCNVEGDILHGGLNIFAHRNRLRHSMFSIPSFYRFWLPDKYTFLDGVNKRDLEELENERGVSIVSTHFASSYSDVFYNGTWEEANPSTFSAYNSTYGWNTSFTYRLNLSVKEKFDHIASLGGWYVPVKAILQRWDDIGQVDVRNSGGCLEIRNPSGEILEDLALECSDNEIQLLMDLDTYGTISRDDNGVFRIGDVGGSSSRNFLVLGNYDELNPFQGFIGLAPLQLIVENEIIDVKPGYRTGIYLFDTSRTTLSRNKCMNNHCGILVDSGSGNSLRFNEIHDSSDYGLITGYLTFNNSIINNNFIGNDRDHRAVGSSLPQAIDLGSSNLWNDTAQGNYWSNYRDRYNASTENGTVWTTPYIINSTRSVMDSRPLLHPIDHTPPSAYAGWDITIDQYREVVFNAKDSSDNIGIASYTWTFRYNDKEVILYGERPSFTYYTPGRYEVKLVVSDAGGNIAVDSVVVTVIEMVLPHADAGEDISVLGGDLVRFNGSDSSSEKGIVNYTWNLLYNGSVVTLYGSNAAYVFDIPGNYTITLIIMDSEGYTDQDVMNITVSVTPDDIDNGIPADKPVDTKKKESFFSTSTWLIIIIGAIIVVCIIVYLLVPRGRKKIEQQSDEKKKEKVD